MEIPILESKPREALRLRASRPGCAPPARPQIYSCRIRRLQLNLPLHRPRTSPCLAGVAQSDGWHRQPWPRSRASTRCRASWASFCLPGAEPPDEETGLKCADPAPSARRPATRIASDECSALPHRTINLKGLEHLGWMSGGARTIVKGEQERDNGST